MKKAGNFWVILFLCICLFSLGVLSEKHIFRNYFLKREKLKNDSVAAISKNTLKLTNPLLDYKPNFSFIGPKLESVIIDNVNSYKKNKNIGLVSVYFKDLNSGTCFGVNEKENFIPESLNHLILMMAALKLSEESPDLVSYRFSFNEASNTFKKIDTTEIKDKKATIYDIYSIVEYLILYPSIETENFLKNLLNSINRKTVNKVYLDFGVQNPAAKEQRQITIKDFASLLGVLYNSTYINIQNSEKALFFLSEMEFKDGLVKGINNDKVMVAHMYDQTGNNKLFQMNDCGIIYYPKNSYVLCVMIKGTDINQMTNVIQGVSKAVFDEMKVQVPAIFVNNSKKP